MPAISSNKPSAEARLGADAGSASMITPPPSYVDIVAELQGLLEDRWYVVKKPATQQSTARKTTKARASASSHGSPAIATALAQQQRALARHRRVQQQMPSKQNTTISAPWWEPSVRQRRLQQLSAAIEHGEHDIATAADYYSAPGPGETAALLVRQLLTSTRHGPLTQPEVLACASVLTGLCASHAAEVVAACEGLLERWAIERLDLVWGANTEQAAEVELSLLLLLGHACSTAAGCEHTRAVPSAGRVLRRLQWHELLGERARPLIEVLGYEEQGDPGGPAPMSSVTSDALRR